MTSRAARSLLVQTHRLASATRRSHCSRLGVARSSWVATDPVAKAERSPEAKRKARQKTTAAGQPCHSFRTLLSELALIARTTNRITGTDATFPKIAKANGVQRRALELVDLDPDRL